MNYKIDSLEGIVEKLVEECSSYVEEEKGPKIQYLQYLHTQWSLGAADSKFGRVHRVVIVDIYESYNIFGVRQIWRMATNYVSCINLLRY